VQPSIVSNISFSLPIMATNSSENEGPNEAPHNQLASAEKFNDAAFDAVEANDLHGLKSILQQWQSDASVEGPSTDEIYYLLPKAVKGTGNPAVVEYLLCQGATIDDHITSMTTSKELFELYIKHGWKANETILASHLSQPDLIFFFISNGADPNSALASAALRGPLKTVKLLLFHGASPVQNSVALNAAAQGSVSDRIPVLDCLLAHGADINGIADDFMGPSEARRAGRKGTPLHTAAKWDQREFMKWLVEHGADPEAKNELGETPAEFGKRFEKDGPERSVRIRRAIIEKHAAKKEKEERDGIDGKT
jgi:hypothetical protein